MKNNPVLKRLASLALLAALTACGGGGGGGGGEGGGSASPDPVTAPGANTGTVNPGANTGVQPGGGGSTSQDLGVEFRVNTTTALSQESPGVARFADGGYVVVWTTQSRPPSPTGFDDPRNGVYAQRYGADGAPVGGETRINDYVAGRDVRGARVATLADGGYLMMWNLVRSSTALGAVQMQRIRPDGSRGHFREDPVYDGGGTWVMADMIGLPDGGYVILSSNTQRFTTMRLHRYAANDSEVGPAQLLSTDTVVQWGASMAAMPDGGFVVAWDGATSANTNLTSVQTDIYVRRFKSDATPAGPDTRVTQSPGAQNSPSVSALQGGGYALAWTSIEGQSLNASPFPKTYVRTQAFRADGSAIGQPTRVDPATDLQPPACPGPVSPTFTPPCPPFPSQGGASVTGLDGGGYVVSWSTLDRPGRLYARRYDNQGTPVGAVTRATSDTPFEKGETGPQAVSTGNGGFVILWQSAGEDGDMGGIYARQWGPNGLR